MGYYAKIELGKVTNVIVCDPSQISSQDGVYVETAMDGSIRNKYAAIGDSYDSVNDVFISPQPYQSWSLSHFNWVAPVPAPNDGNRYQWDETNQTWVEFV